MAKRLGVDPRLPYQFEGGLLAMWRPRGRDRDDRPRGLICSLRACTTCPCSVAIVSALLVDDRLLWVKHERGQFITQWTVPREEHGEMKVFHLALDVMTGELTDPRGGELPAPVRPFVAEPIPAWALNDIRDQWRKRLDGEDDRLEVGPIEWKPSELHRAPHRRRPRGVRASLRRVVRPSRRS